MIDVDVTLQRAQFTLAVKLRLERQVTGLFGLSGAGKSTLLGIIAGLVRPDAGRVVVDGTTLFDRAAGIDVPVHHRRIGLVFQDSRLFPHLTVRANLLYGWKRLPPGARVFQPDQIIRLLELEPLLSQLPHRLSGGEKQRVALGRALLSSPRLLLLDEPLASLDYRLKNQILPFLKRIATELRLPMLYVSHTINEILYLTPDIVFMERGGILAHGPFHQTLRAPEVLALADSLGLENILDARVLASVADADHGEVECGGQKILIPAGRARPGTTVTLSIRASNVALALAPVTGTTIQNQLPGTVLELREAAARALVSIDIGRVILAEVSLPALRQLGITPGARVFCLIKAQSIEVLGQS